MLRHPQRLLNQIKVVQFNFVLWLVPKFFKYNVVKHMNSPVVFLALMQVQRFIGFKMNLNEYGNTFLAISNKIDIIF